MTSNVKHIAKTGKKKGEWVDCSAKIRCQNGGVHVDTRNLYKARDLLLEKTGRNYTAISRIPLTELRRVLNSDEIRPNNLPAKNSKATVHEVVKEPYASKPKKIAKHFNEGSSFTEIMQTVYGQNEYKVSYPIVRKINFDKHSRTEKEEAVQYLNKARTGSWARLNFAVKGDSIHVKLENDEQMKLWAPAETHNIISWLRWDATNASKKGKHPEFLEQFEQEKTNYINYLKTLGISDLLD